MTIPATSLAAAMFDMDGVLIQSRAAIERGWRSAAREYGIDVTDDDVREHIHGRTASHTLEKVFGELSVEQRRAVQQRVDEIEERSDCELTEGVAAFLHELVSTGVPTALVTSSWPARISHVLRSHDLAAQFRVIVHRNEVTLGKPSPECYELAARRLGVPTRSCIVFEDAQSGVLAAVRSGAVCIGIGDDPGLLPSGALALRPNFVGMRVPDLDCYLRISSPQS